MLKQHLADPRSGTISLDLGLIGNGTSAALVTARGEIVWACFPCFDGDPVFCSLLRGNTPPENDGSFTIELIDAVRSEQEYLDETAIIVTRIFDASGGAIQVTDFAPRFERDAKLYCPSMLVRRIERISGKPSVRLRIRPMQRYGAARIPVETGSASALHPATRQLRYRAQDILLRVETDALLAAIAEETPFEIDEPISVMLGVDDDMQGVDPAESADLMRRTGAWWRSWVEQLVIPRDWREPAVRAAITLKLNVVENTGAIIAAVTTSIPEAPNSGRNWDYRYCWMRDAYFVAAALHRLGDTKTIERYVEFVMRIVDAAQGASLEPMYDIAGRQVPDEHEAPSLPGYRGMGPVRIGNQARVQSQHDIYGEIILAAQPVFANTPGSSGDVELFHRLETLGDRAADLFDKPDAGLWELRGTERVHTFSSVMCWAACNGLAEIAHRLQLAERAAFWEERSQNIREFILRNAWNDRLDSFAATMKGETLDASLLLMQPLGFIGADDPRFRGTVRAIGRDLRRGEFISRYVDSDDFGRPENAFLICTFWYVDALAAIGDLEEARRLFANLLSCRNGHGLLAEDIDPKTRELWGNFVQTYSMAGIIDSSVRLARDSS